MSSGQARLHVVTWGVRKISSGVTSESECVFGSRPREKDRCASLHLVNNKPASIVTGDSYWLGP
jgi:hypothetical protein